MKGSLIETNFIINGDKVNLKVRLTTRNQNYWKVVFAKGK